LVYYLAVSNGETMTWIVYSVGPIDHGWENLKTVKETLAVIASGEVEIEETKDVNAEAVQQFLADWSSAKEAAEKEGWEGDCTFCDSLIATRRCGAGVGAGCGIFG
jgi:hypothetical protein